MPSRLHSDTFNKLAILDTSQDNFTFNKLAILDTSQDNFTFNKTIDFTFNKTIDFYQQQDLDTISVPNPTLERWFGGVLAPNGKIYGMADSGKTPANVLEIDPSSGNTNTISVSNLSGEQWTGGVLAPNGKIYGLPNGGNTPAYVLSFSRTFPQLMNDWILYPQFNKF